LLPAGLGESVPLFTSPLSRCVTLARALHDSAASDARLAEIDFGDWEMRTWDDIGASALDAWAADPIGFTPPGGESPRLALARALDFIDQLGDSGLPAACLVTHGGIMRLLAGHWLRRPENEWIELCFGFGRVAAFDLAAPGGPQALFLDA
jgi:alpha-ribazole phosphatase